MTRGSATLLFNLFSPCIWGGIGLLSGLLVFLVVGTFSKSRGAIMLAVALSAVAYFYPIWVGAGHLVMGAFVQLLFLVTGWVGWKLSKKNCGRSKHN